MVLATVVALMAAACTAGDDDGGTTGGSASGELGQGVTEDTIKIGFTYPDLDALRESGVASTNHGPYPDHIQVLVDDLNGRGGINGRQVEVVTAPIDIVQAASAEAACIELTEDEQVFAVLGTMNVDRVLCYTEQHDVAAFPSGNMTDERLERSTAPYATARVSAQRSLLEFVTRAEADGLFDGRTVAVHSTVADNHGLATDIVVPALEDAGVDVAFESLITVGGDGGDVGGATEAIAVNVEAMRSADVDTVLVVGDSFLAGSTFIAEDFLPRMLFGDMGSAQALAKDEATDLGVFEGAYTFGQLTDVDRFREPTLAENCLPLWDEAHPDDPVRNPTELENEEPNHVVAAAVACQTLAVFEAAATAAGPVLNNETLQDGIHQVGDIDVPGLGAGSLAEGKYDAQDDLFLYEFDPGRAESRSGFVTDDR